MEPTARVNLHRRLLARRTTLVSNEKSQYVSVMPGRWNGPQKLAWILHERGILPLWYFLYIVQCGAMPRQSTMPSDKNIFPMVHLLFTFPLVRPAFSNTCMGRAYATYLLHRKNGANTPVSRGAPIAFSRIHACAIPIIMLSASCSHVSLCMRCWSSFPASAR